MKELGEKERREREGGEGREEGGGRKERMTRGEGKILMWSKGRDVAS